MVVLKQINVEINHRIIGIGTPIAERPSHTTGRTVHVSGGPRFVEATAGQVGWEPFGPSPVADPIVGGVSPPEASLPDTPLHYRYTLRLHPAGSGTCIIP
jgi:hypothetical protein